MEEKRINPIRERLLQHKKLAKLINDFAFKVWVKERGQFLLLIEESYKIGVEDGRLSK